MTTTSPHYDSIIVGGGLFGAWIALTLRRGGHSVLLVEHEADLLQRASYHNQARIHGGYHYPRSLTTALRSSLNYSTFVNAFPECVVADFHQIYAVARHHSKVSANQFLHAMRRVNAPMEKAPVEIRNLFCKELIEEVFTVREPVFNARLLKESLRNDLEEAGVAIRYRTTALAVSPVGRPPLCVTLATADGTREEATACHVFNCTYNQANRLHQASGIPLIPLRYELTEMALIQLPPPLQSLGVTVMCGPFFSMMPFPDRQAHTLSHVRYTPHASWEDREGQPHRPITPSDLACPSHYPLMLKDAARYLPALAEATQCGSLWEIKTILPLNDIDDGRPILFASSKEIPHFYTVVGGKIDNVFDLTNELQSVIAS